MRSRLLFGALAASLSACTPTPAAVREPPPALHAQATDWQYGVYLLSVANDPSAAEHYLQQAQAEIHGDLPGSDALLFERDLAEASFFAGDFTAADQAARDALDKLSLEPVNAQFQADDRSLYQRDLAAVEAASTNDLDRLTQLSQTQASPPDADTWYLLGWVRERAGDFADAQTAYRHYLDLAPAWSFLRSASLMRAHAKQAVARS